MDTFDSTAMTLVLLLTLFSILDAVFTLHLIAHGGSELNPVMDYFLQQSVSSFMIAKLCLTAIPAVIITAMGDSVFFGRFRPRPVLGTMIGLYASLLLYELGLLSLV